MPINALANLNVKLGFIFDTKSLAAVEKSLQRTGDRLAKTGQNISLFISAPLALIGGNAIKAAGEFESLSLAMQATFKNAGRTIGEANAEVEALRKAALAPGLDFQQAVSASIRLQSVGLSAENARGVIVELANAIASTGGTAENLSSVTVQMSQMISKGKVLSQDLRIIQENLPIISDLMLKAFGTSNAEKIQELGITGKNFVEGITKEMTKLTRVQGGISNALVNAGSAVKQALAGIGEEIARVFNITDLSDRFASALHSIVEGFKGLSDGTKKAIVYVGALLVAMGPLLAIMGGIYSVSARLVGAFATVGKALSVVAGFVSSCATAFNALNLATRAFIVIGIVTALASLAYNMGAFNKELTSAEKAQQALNDVQREAVSSIAGEKSAVDTLIATINSEVSSRDAKARALENLKSISPAYFGQLKVENGLVTGLTAAYDDYVKSLLNSARAEAAKGKLVEIERQLLDLEDQRAAKLIEGQKAAAFVGVSAQQVAEREAAAYEKQVSELTAKKTVLTGVVIQSESANASTVKSTAVTTANTTATEANTKTKKKQSEEVTAAKKAEEDYLYLVESEIRFQDRINENLKEEAENRKNIEDIKKANQNFEPIGPRGQTPLAQPIGITDAQQGLFDSAPISLAAQNIAFLREKMDELKASASQVGQAFNIAADGISSIAGVIGSALESTSGSWADFAKSALTAIADVIGALIKLAVTQAFAASLKASSFLGPLAIPIAAAAGALAASLLKGLINRSSFAKGTNDAPGGLSLVGEKGPELVNLPRHSQVFPAHRTSAMLGDMGGGGAVQLFGEFAVRGTDLVLVLDRVQQKQNRVR